MSGSLPERPLVVAPRSAWLLPPAFLLHQVEEWLGGFSAWTAEVLGRGVSPQRFLILNAIAWLLFTGGTVAARRSSRMAWFAASFAALLGLNGILHALATVGLGRFAPGTITGLLVSLPVSAVVLRASAPRLAPGTLSRAMAIGVLIHVVVVVVAYA